MWLRHPSRIDSDDRLGCGWRREPAAADRGSDSDTHTPLWRNRASPPSEQRAPSRVALPCYYCNNYNNYNGFLVPGIHRHPPRLGSASFARRAGNTSGTDPGMTRMTDDSDRRPLTQSGALPLVQLGSDSELTRIRLPVRGRYKAVPPFGAFASRE